MAEGARPGCSIIGVVGTTSTAPMLSCPSDSVGTDTMGALGTDTHTLNDACFIIKHSG